MDDRLEPAFLLCSREAAKLMNISQRTLWSLTFETTPALPHVRINRLVRYLRDDLVSYAKDHKMGGEK